jgi:hypothetical protein
MQALGQLALLAVGAGTDVFKRVASLLGSLEQEFARRLKRLNHDNDGIDVLGCEAALAGAGEAANPSWQPKLMPQVCLYHLAESFLKTWDADAGFATWNRARDVVRTPGMMAANTSGGINWLLQFRAWFGFFGVL